MYLSSSTSSSFPTSSIHPSMASATTTHKFCTEITLKELPKLPQTPSLPNPISSNPFFFHASSQKGFYISPSDIVLHNILHDLYSPPPPLPAYHRAGPRRRILFHPSHVNAAIVTCGGLCPGLNTVIRELVIGLWNLYNVRNIFGIKSGFRGFYSSSPPLPLSPTLVHNWHKLGGTSLQTSRGGFHLQKIVDAIEAHKFNQIYIIGGDGSMRGAVEIHEEIQRRGLIIGVAGIPKTVDNDVGIIDKSFGFDTAVERAQEAIAAAHVEAESGVNGVGLVKVMGRSTGHIALHATLSSRDVDCCLIPEVDFFMEGEGGLLRFVEERLRENGHAVVVVAEGAGQKLMEVEEDGDGEKDESGNGVLKDIGRWVKDEMMKWWRREHEGELLTVKYIDPTYMVRAVAANSRDNLYCTLVAHSAIHGVMAGYTGFVAAPVNGNYVYIPVREVAVARNLVNVEDHKWAWVRSVNSQPDFVK